MYSLGNDLLLMQTLFKNCLSYLLSRGNSWRSLIQREISEKDSPFQILGENFRKRLCSADTNITFSDTDITRTRVSTELCSSADILGLSMYSNRKLSLVRPGKKSFFHLCRSFSYPCWCRTRVVLVSGYDRTWARLNISWRTKKIARSPSSRARTRPDTTRCWHNLVLFLRRPGPCPPSWNHLSRFELIRLWT